MVAYAPHSDDLHRAYSFHVRYIAEELYNPSVKPYGYAWLKPINICCRPERQLNAVGTIQGNREAEIIVKRNSKSKEKSGASSRL